jgi:V/A-type H+/Na+-transporting ATPase subunit E
MSLEAILAAIRASSEQQVEAIERQAAVEAAAIREAARREADKERHEACARAALPAHREHSRIIHRARLLHLRTVGDAREAAIDTALAAARSRLAAARSDAGYPIVLQRLAEEALAELASSLEDVARARLEADPRDESILAPILRQHNLEAATGYQLDCWGGVVARSEDGRITVINTLESRLERVTPFLRRYLATLFAGGESTRPTTITETLAFGR